MSAPFRVILMQSCARNLRKKIGFLRRGKYGGTLSPRCTLLFLSCFFSWAALPPLEKYPRAKKNAIFPRTSPCTYDTVEIFTREKFVPISSTHASNGSVSRYFLYVHSTSFASGAGVKITRYCTHSPHTSETGKNSELAN